MHIHSFPISLNVWFFHVCNSSLFSCLNSLATVDDFYTNCHVLYGKTRQLSVLSSYSCKCGKLDPSLHTGIEAILNGLSASMKLRAHTATQIGYVCEQGCVSVL